ncbi:MAG: hypothetical protein FWG70_06945 [Oscillospiraceae bacterium]|nr:hypothetical protein [Oscillospiraceae bacterium]
MQAYEFQTTRTEDIIRIPPKFTKGLAKNIRVIILSEDPNSDSVAKLKATEQKRRETWERLEKFRSSIQPRPDFDEKAELAAAREEKYGRFD